MEIKSGSHWVSNSTGVKISVRSEENNSGVEIVKYMAIDTLYFQQLKKEVFLKWFSPCEI